MILSHFTCSHGHAAIQRDGLIRPQPQPFLDGVELSWWTDDPGQTAYALGLQSAVLLSCDRMEFHYLADVPAVRWADWKNDWAGGSLLRMNAISELEFGRQHRCWWVCTEPVEWESVGS